MGELHLEICTHRLQNEFNVNIRYGKPRVAFRETLLSPCSITGVFDKSVINQVPLKINSMYL